MTNTFIKDSITKNFFYISVEKLFGVLSAFIALVLAARFFDSSEYGNMLIAFALVTSFIYLYTLNLNQIVLKDLVTKDDSKVVISTTFFIRLYASIISFFAANVVAYFFLNDAFQYVLIISMSILFTPFESYELYLHSRQRFLPGSLVRSSAYIISIILQICVVSFGFDFIFFIAVILIERSIVGIIFIIFFRNFRSKINFNFFSNSLCQYYLSNCWKEVLNGISIVLMLRFPLFYIGYFGSDKDKAIFGTALRVMDVFLTVMQAYSKVIMPTFFRKYSRNVAEAMIFFKKQLSIYLITIFLSILASIFLSSSLFLIFFGKDLSESSNIFNILVFTPYIHSLAIMSGCLLIAKNKIIVNTIRSSLGLFVCITLTPILINEFGLIGGSYTIIISTMVSFMLYSFFSKELRFISWIKTKAFFTAGLIYLRPHEKN